MRVVQVPQAGGPLELVERDIPEPERGWVRVKVEACGVCHSDSLVKEGLWPGIQYPRVPGHEVIGFVDGVGEGVKPWKTGQRVGVGWHAGNCGYCDHCRRGEFFACTVALLTTGISFDGGYAEYMVAPAQALALVPDELSSVDSAPLMCAGVTTFNALRNSGARGGDVVAVLGIGGMGEVQLSKDKLIGRDVALKVMLDGTKATEDARDRFLREARIQGQLEHPAHARRVGRVVDEQHVAGAGRQRAERAHAAVHARVDRRRDVGAAPAPTLEAAPEVERLVGHRVVGTGAGEDLVDVHGRCSCSRSRRSRRSLSWPT